MIPTAAKSVLNGIADPVMIVDFEGQVLFANKAAKKEVSALTQLKTDDLLDRSIFSMFHDEDGCLARLLANCKTTSGLIPSSLKTHDDEGGEHRIVVHGTLQRFEIGKPPAHIMLRFVQANAISAHRFEELNDQLKRKNSAFLIERKLARYDPLTNLFNRRTTFEELEREIEKANRSIRPLSLLLLDLDLFKKINDNFGHPGGDEVLKDIAKILRKQIRRIDIAGRIGGEEFAVILPETKLDQALDIATRICNAVSRNRSVHQDQIITVTASIGAVEHSNEEGINDIYSRADRALYMAKAGGRNRVVGSVDNDDALDELKQRHQDIEIVFSEAEHRAKA